MGRRTTRGSSWRATSSPSTSRSRKPWTGRRRWSTLVRWMEERPWKQSNLLLFLFLNSGLLDATLDLDFENISELEAEIDSISKWDVIKGRPWINWNMRFLQHAPLNHAALALQMLLPGKLISFWRVKNFSSKSTPLCFPDILVGNLNIWYHLWIEVSESLISLEM